MQIMKLNLLSPAIQELHLFLEPVDAGRDAVTKMRPDPDLPQFIPLILGKTNDRTTSMVGRACLRWPDDCRARSWEYC